MKTNRYLLPHAFKKVGWLLFIPLVLYFAWEIDALDWLFRIWDSDNSWANPMPVRIYNYLYTILPVGFSIALLMIGFSREKVEDEYIMKLRGDSLISAVIASYIIVVIGSLLFYGFKYFGFMACNMFTVLVLYVAIFNIKLFRLRRESKSKK